MLKNYLLIAFRNLWRQKGFSAINILGLGIGMACSILILLWVKNELSYNRFNEKTDRIYRVVQTQHYVAGPLTTTCMPGPIARDLKKDIPEITNSFMYYVIYGVVTSGDKFFNEEIRLADPALWDMFTFDFLRGDPKHVFDDLNSVVITDKFAGKYYGAEDPVGKIIKINNEHLFKVTGVIRETPVNSTFRFDLCIPFENLKNMGLSIDQYGSNSFFSYVELPPGTNYRNVNEKIRDYLMLKYKALFPQEVEDFKSTVDLYLFPLSDIYLHSVTGGGGRVTAVYIFSLIAVFILLIACINFMNLSTARAARRSREIGLRKVAGATKYQIITQFLGESLLITLLSFVLAVALVYFFLPGFNVLTGKALALDWSDLKVTGGMVIIIILVGVVSGSYPAFYLSSLQPATIVKNTPFKGRGSRNFRRILVVFQFMLSVALIISTIVVYRQLAFIDKKDIGLDRENVIYVEMKGKTAQSYKMLKSEFLQNPDILNVTRADALPFDIGSNGGGYNWEGKETKDDVLIGFGTADADYIQTMGMNMMAGRFFQDDYGTDTSSAVVLNEKAVSVMGLKNPVGEWITRGEQRYNVIGVVQDFYFLPMSYEIGPLALYNLPQYSRILFVKTDGKRMDQIIDKMQKTWEKINPGFPFEYKLLDDSYDELYASEDRLGNIFKYFSILAIVISCLGLFGLAAFMAEQRTKEIGIRKVMGAEVPNLVIKLSGEFLIWVLIANIIAWPVTYIIMGRWLQDYAYHTRLTPWIFILATALSLVIAFMTVSSQVFWAATRDPVNSLKYE
jgi:putative ABC transport system permease protein